MQCILANKQTLSQESFNGAPWRRVIEVTRAILHFDVEL
jgi:hypothetical protein